MYAPSNAQEWPACIKASTSASRVVHDGRIGRSCADRSRHFWIAGPGAHRRGASLRSSHRSIARASTARLGRAAGGLGCFARPPRPGGGADGPFLWSLARQVGKLRASVALKRRCGLWAIGGAVIACGRASKPRGAGNGGPWGLRRVVSLGKGPTDSMTPTRELGSPLFIASWKGWPALTASFSNFVVANRRLRSSCVRCLPRAPLITLRPCRWAHAEMIERERGCLAVNLARAAPKPGAFPRPGRERDNVASTATLWAASRRSDREARHTPTCSRLGRALSHSPSIGTFGQFQSDCLTRRLLMLLI